MARKKKQQTDNLKIISRKLTYSGAVSVNVLKNGTKIQTIDNHNAGTINLCETIAKLLIGQSSLAQLPGKIVACDQNGPLQRTVAIMALPEETRTGIESNYAFSKLTFLIPNSTISSGTKITGFNLYPNKATVADESQLYASVTLPETIEMSPDTSLEVEWTLKIMYE